MNIEVVIFNEGMRIISSMSNTRKRMAIMKNWFLNGIFLLVIGINPDSKLVDDSLVFIIFISRKSIRIVIIIIKAAMISM